MKVHEHDYVDSDKRGYVVCSTCGTYKSVGLLSAQELYEDNYWSPEKGRSTMQEQIYNMDGHKEFGITKVDKILSFITNPGKLLEIACAPGVFMKKAKEIGCDVTGIEPDIKNIYEIKRISGNCGPVILGYFPDCSIDLIPPYDYIIAMDVVEHVIDYKNFIEAAYSILSVGGRFVFMSPINTATTSVREKDYIPEEHAHIFSEKYLTEYLNGFFAKVRFDRWADGHDIVICDK